MKSILSMENILKLFINENKYEALVETKSGALYTVQVNATDMAAAIHKIEEDSAEGCIVTEIRKV